MGKRRKPLDDNDLAAAGELPADPADDCDEVAPPERLRPVHQVRDGEGHRAVAFAIDAIGRDERVYQRGPELVTVVAWGDGEERGFTRASGAPVISKVSAPRLWTWLSETVRFEAWAPRAKGFAPTNPPKDVVMAVLAAAGEWRGVRPLVGISTTPILRHDGSVHITQGYDDATGLYYAPDDAPPELPRHPSKDDARAAAALLLGVVKDFPFASDVDRAGWLAALLTPLARPLTPTVPMFVFDANAAGSGKSLLCEVIGRIVTGRPMACGPHVTDDAEVRKRILTHAIAGDVLVLIDNAPNGWAIGWPSLDLALTATELVDRVLGETRQVSAPNNMVWYLTGNNLGVRGDTARRTVRVRLESPLERPECRETSEFEHPDLQAWVAEQHGRLLGAALTVLAAYLQAGRPTSGLAPLGSFGAWSRVVRDAIVWLELGDVGTLVAAADPEADPRVGAHVQLLESLIGHRDGLTAAGMLEQVNGEPCYDPDLRDALTELVPGKRGGIGDARQIGHALRELRNRVRSISENRSAKLVRLNKSDDSKSKNATRWGVEVTQTGCRGVTGCVGVRTRAADVAHAHEDIDIGRAPALAGKPEHPVTPRHPVDQQGFFEPAEENDTEEW